MNTLAEIERAIEHLPPGAQREVFELISAKLEASGQEAEFPDLKALLLEIPDVGTDADFERVRAMPPDLNFQ